MAPVLLRAVPWPALLGLTAAGAGTGALAVLIHGGPALVVLQMSLVLVGAAAACALDDPAAAVVGACPLRRSTVVAARALGAALALVVGAGGVVAWWARDALDRMLLLELVGCWVLGFVLAVLAQARLDEPAEVVASGLVLVLLTVLFVDRIGRRLALFPGDDLRTRGVRTWWVVMAACAVGLVVAVRPRRWR